IDQLRWLIPTTTAGDTGILGLRAIPVARFVLFLLAPLAIVVVGFRDNVRRYALGVGDWRWGASLLIAGLAVMTPIILGLSALPAFRGYYGAAASPLGVALLNNVVELIPAEFLLRGFLMFALWRRIGPLALVVVQVPFVLTHVGKPDVELWSTFIGGSIFAGLDWRARGVLWGGPGDVYGLSLLFLAGRAAPPLVDCSGL